VLAAAAALPHLVTARLIVRLACIEDAAAIARYYRDNHVFLRPWEPARSGDFFSEAYWRRQAVYACDEFWADRSCRLFLFLPESRDRVTRVIGSANFVHFVRGVSHSCTLGYSLGEAQQGQGYMSEALRAALVYVFDELRMHRVQANYIPRNERSGRLLRRLSFVHEGYARDFLRINGCWEDHLLTSLTNPHWYDDL
jgi:ribosomal-protein-alanine N-acetyltransferase